MFPAKSEKNQPRVRRRIPLRGGFLFAVVALLITATKVWAIPLASARIIIEINGTAGDAGIQVFLDGEGWNSCQISDPNGNLVLDVQASGSVGTQGVTELFFESAEPSFAQQPLAALLALFPEGAYRFDCMTTEGQMLKGSATLTHRLPAAPIVTPQQGEEVDPTQPVVIKWEAVTTAFPGGESRVVVDGYEIIVERLKDGRKFSVTLPATSTSVTVPPEFIQPNTEYKFEVLAIERDGNQTISESSFNTTK